LDGGAERGREGGRIGFGEELTVSGSAQDDFDATSRPVAHESNEGMRGAMQARGNTADGQLGLGAERLGDVRMVRVQDDIH
jgi:hypothetical protein